jgi:hypothetical protein
MGRGLTWGLVVVGSALAYGLLAPTGEAEARGRTRWRGYQRPCYRTCVGDHRASGHGCHMGYRHEAGSGPRRRGDDPGRDSGPADRERPLPDSPLPAQAPPATPESTPDTAPPSATEATPSPPGT